jgi:[ribosomal protein S5]-alanine N-acetyltransferase
MSDVFLEFPIIELDKNYVLRDLQLKDREAYWALMNHPKVMPFLPSGCVPSDLEAAAREIQYRRDVFNRRLGFCWAIVEKKTNKLIGACGFELWNRFHHRLEISYDVHPDYWRQGIATKAVIAVMDFAFQKLEAKRVEAFTITENVASINLLLKLGFHNEGLLKKYRFYQDNFIDVLIFGYTEDDYHLQKTALDRLAGVMRKALG